MSRLTAVPISFYPSGSTPGLTTTPASAWGWSGWTEVITSAAANLHLAAIEVYCSVSQTQFEVEVGVGALGVEVGLHRFRSRISSASAETNHGVVDAPLPLGGITTGNRVSVRVRCSQIIATDFRVGLMAYEGLSDTTHLTSAAMKSVPDGANAPTLTPSGTAWTYSSWVELTPGISTEISVVGIVPSAPISTVEYEYELGYGAGGAEVPFGTIRTSCAQFETGGMRTFYLPVPRPFVPSTRIAVRMRKTGTSTTSHNVALVYLDNTDTTALPATASETITVTDVVSTQLTNDIYKTVFETITVAESTTLRPNKLLISVAETISLDDDASIPLGVIPSDRIFVREYVALVPNTLTIRVSETITVTESPLYPSSDGVPGTIGTQPPAPTGSTGVVDYWLTGI